MLLMHSSGGRLEKSQMPSKGFEEMYSEVNKMTMYE